MEPTHMQHTQHTYAAHKQNLKFKDEYAAQAREKRDQ